MVVAVFVFVCAHDADAEDLNEDGEDAGVEGVEEDGVKEKDECGELAELAQTARRDARARKQQRELDRIVAHDLVADRVVRAAQHVARSKRPRHLPLEVVVFPQTRRKCTHKGILARLRRLGTRLGAVTSAVPIRRQAQSIAVCRDFRHAGGARGGRRGLEDIEEDAGAVVKVARGSKSRVAENSLGELVVLVEADGDDEEGQSLAERNGVDAHAEVVRRG